MNFQLYLKTVNACKSAQEWAAGKTFEQVYNTCHRGDWLCWLFAYTNPDDLQLLTLLKGLQVNEIRHLLTDSRSIAAVDAAIAFGRGAIGIKQLKDAAASAYAASYADAAADDVYAAARNKSFARSADIFRKNISIDKINRVWETI
jgi:hypothetical protein